MKNSIIFIILFGALYSCAYVDLLTNRKVEVEELKGTSQYSYKDISGQYLVERKFGVNKAGDFVSKKVLFSSSAKNFLERFISIAKKQNFNVFSMRILV